MPGTCLWNFDHSVKAKIVQKFRALRARGKCKYQMHHSSRQKSFTTQMEKSKESDSDRSDVRVKVYVLNEKRVWDDKGTGHVTFDDDGSLIVVRAEAPEHKGMY